MCQKLDIYARKLHPVNFLLKALAPNLSKNFYLREKARFCTQPVAKHCASSLCFIIFLSFSSRMLFLHAVLPSYMHAFLSNFNKVTWMNIIPSTTIVFSGCRLLTSRWNSTCIFNNRLATFFSWFTHKRRKVALSSLI